MRERGQGSVSLLRRIHAPTQLFFAIIGMFSGTIGGAAESLAENFLMKMKRSF